MYPFYIILRSVIKLKQASSHKLTMSKEPHKVTHIVVVIVGDWRHVKVMRGWVSIVILGYISIPILAFTPMHLHHCTLTCV